MKHILNEDVGSVLISLSQTFQLIRECTIKSEIYGTRHISVNKDELQSPHCAEDDTSVGFKPHQLAMSL